MKYGWHTDIQWLPGTMALLYSGVTLSKGVLGMRYLFVFFVVFLVFLGFDGSFSIWACASCM